VERHAECFLAPDHRLGVERLAHACHETKGAEVVLTGGVSAQLHQHADRGRRRVPDRDLLLLEDPVPELGVELGLHDDIGDAAGERRDDPIAGAGDPARIGRAPEDVLRVQVEHELAGDVVGDHRLVDVDRALRAPGGAAREVQKRHVLRIGRRDLKVFVGISHQRAPVERARNACRLPVLTHENHVIEACQLLTHVRDLAPVQAFGRDQHLTFADTEPCLDRLWAERGEQRAEHA
jgi:hypothetical protein